MNSDFDLEALREDWQTEDSIPPALRRNVERQSRWMKIGLAGDILVTVVIGGGATAWALLSGQKDAGYVAFGTWMFIAGAWMFVLMINRGLWAPSATDAATFVDLSIRRCQASLAATWFAAMLFVAEMVFGLSWAYTHADLHEFIGRWLLFSFIQIDVVWISTVVFAIGILWFRSKKKRELARLLDLRRTMGEADQPSKSPSQAQ